MPSKLVPGRVRKPAEARRSEDLALVGGLCVYLCVYCTLVVGLALGLYELMQPTRYPNPGVSAHAPAFRSALVLASPIEPATEAENGQGVKADGRAAREPGKAQNLDHATAAVAAKRPRPAHPKGRDAMTDRGAQPAFGSYRP